MAPLADVEVISEDIVVEDSTNNVLFTLTVLKIIKEAQMQHGMRHGDNQRYRQYCSRRLARIRKSLNFPQGTKHKVVSKKITEANLTDIRFLYLPLIEAERAWSYAMQLRTEANSEPRKRFHMLSRLKKSAQHAQTLADLVQQSAKCDALSKLEAKAYISWIRGTLAFELSQWKIAIDFFNGAKTIYSELSTEDSDIYGQRVREIVPSLRYCAYNIGDTSAIEELADLKTSDEDSHSNINDLIAKTREKLASTMVETTWRERCVPVRNEKVRLFLLSMKNHDGDLAKAKTDEQRIDLHESLLKDIIDAQNSLRDDLVKEDVTVKSQLQPGIDDSISQVNNGVFLYTYIVYIRMTTTAERNLLMAKNLIEEKKLSKPQDVARLYDITVQNFTELTGYQAIKLDEELSEELSTNIDVYSCFRCYYMAMTHSYASRYPETLALFNRTHQYIATATQRLQKTKNTARSKDLLKQLETLSGNVESSGYAVHAQSILSVQESSPNLFTEPSSKILEKPLCDRSEYFSQKTVRRAKIVALPPKFRIAPGRPLFFDVAQSMISLPQGIKEKLPAAHATPAKSLSNANDPTEGKAGITGMMKGWLWGGNKK